MRALPALLFAILFASSTIAQTQEEQPIADSDKAAQDPGSTEIEFLTLQQGQQEIIDETYESYISGATDNFLRFCIGATADAPIPLDKSQRRELAESALKEKVLVFSETEKEQLRHTVSGLHAQIGELWPLISKVPWRFLKVDSSLCAGFPHTRGRTIILPAGILPTLQYSPNHSMNLLLHEKLHVIQRLYPERFKDLYRQYGFQKIQLANGEIARVDYGQNPDAFQVEWAIKLGDELSMLIPVFQTRNDGQLRFASEYRDIVKGDDGQYRFGEIREIDEAFKQWRNGFNSSNGLGHPNETSAYLSAPVLQTVTHNADASGSHPITPLQKTRIEQTQKAFEDILRIEESQ